MGTSQLTKGINVDAAHNATNHRNNPLWIYSVKQYSSADCSEFLLDSQQKFHLDINILLFIGWLATQNKSVDMKTVNASEVINWQLKVISPIRELRRRVKSLNAVDFYQHMKKLELEAEYQEQLKLHALTHHMTKQNWKFNKFIQEGCEQYFKELEQRVDKQWLQTLTEHLQPK